jgi:hypothetical protein
MKKPTRNFLYARAHGKQRLRAQWHGTRHGNRCQHH